MARPQRQIVCETHQGSVDLNHKAFCALLGQTTHGLHVLRILEAGTPTVEAAVIIRMFFWAPSKPPKLFRNFKKKMHTHNEIFFPPVR